MRLATSFPVFVGWVVEVPDRLGEGLVLTKPPGGSFDVDDGGAVEEAVQDGGGDHAVAAEQFG